MILSFWRYSHLALAVSSFIFILIASLTGIILAVEPVSNQLEVGLASEATSEVSLAQTLAALSNRYDEVLSVAVDENDLVKATVIDENGDFSEFYINPLTGEKTADLIESAPIYQFATNLHRSLFLKSIGRFFVGLASLLLFFISVSGIALIIRRQQGIKRFFARVLRDNFFQYYHVYLGRLSLIPIVIITLTGVYLSLLRFEVIPATSLSHDVDYENIQAEPKLATADFPIFNDIKLDELRTLEFPFSDDVEDYYLVSLQSKEVLVNQFTGEVLSELKYPFVDIASRWSIDLHTGRGSIFWSVILGLASISTLFFIYSGFAMTLRRRASRIKNKYKKNQAKYIILVGSESGSTIRFATILHQQLLAAGQKSYLAEMNRYSEFKKMEHLIVFAATYGVGEPPANAKKFEKRFTKFSSKNPYSFSVVGFGSLAYSNFCQYAFDVDKLLQTDSKAHRMLEPYTINNRSWEAFNQWVNQWGEHVGLDISVPQENPITQKRKKKQSFEVIEKTEACDSPDDTFTVTLKTDSFKFQSGDLLAVYPNDETHERLYSIGLNNRGEILLSIKRHSQGLCSNYINDLKVGEKLQASIVKNRDFHFPKRARKVLMISTGTGIAPFLGMMNHNHKKIETELMWGGRNEASFELYKEVIEGNLSRGYLSKYAPAYSRAQAEKLYVQHLVKRDAEQIAALLKAKGVIMICGSIAMQKEVTATLDIICRKANKKPLSYYQNKGQLKMDCY
ncbi:Oxidoreductase FAD-binding domain/Oxidoreductase NAD-binding domain/Flavodoxin [Owenweeksia hongkongensis DSM 17368]|uniref:NADPH--hemoprotein reductase n=1 Tax=Owenweeksia hongkongensis (strain DSM 17368 / CIP 108786 / JCM 12287 / NRRL B-23963 / UST20020801) TaxID=926562 RepID=G8R7J2_OWEHD|nr:PepSY domain-containing protein [Owenweeksia hongkongensis]AEV32345.1 Oxidoreductase FAD-binding domain/Oxidoreductase NAD-binding domain/Flavodoxin [Owenweeksia hongkongensis DSM 17368]